MAILLLMEWNCWAILAKGIMRNISVKLFLILTSGSGQMLLKTFLF